MKKITDREIKNLIYRGYIDRFKNERLFSTLSYVPISLIEFYLQTKQELYIPSKIYDAFKIKYILSENKLEGIQTDLEEVEGVVKNTSNHAREEVLGLAEVYEYISRYSFENIMNFNIYTLLKIHQILFSKSKFNECGGKFREFNACISDSNVETADYTIIPKEISNLYPHFNEILKYADDIEKYLEEIIKLHAKLIQIHPFFDGNGRSTRALFNLQLRYVGLPPIYVKLEEKEAYCKALQEAIVDGEFKKLIQFFLFKIANAIIEHDANFAVEALSVL